MEPNMLSKFYDTLKADLNQPDTAPGTPVVITGPAVTDDQITHFRKICHNHAGGLKEKCRKHIILDIYAKVLPLDDDWKCGHMGILKKDVDDMIASKGDTPTEYLTSAYEATQAPLLEFVLRSTDGIVQRYLEAEEEEIKDAKETDVPLEDPPEPDEDTEDISSQLVDIKDDMDYNTFIEELKKKTINKIVDDVSKLIEGEKEKNDMTFNTSDDSIGESVVLTCVDWMQHRLMTEHVDHYNEEEMLSMAIREATMYELNRTFNLAKSFNEFASIIRYGHGVVINESAISYLRENVITE